MIQKIPDLGLIVRLLSDCINNPLVSSKAIQELKIIKPEDKLSKIIQTLAIDATGTVYINLAFWQKQIRNEQDARFVIYHEILHHILGDLTRLESFKDAKGNVDEQAASIANLAMDTRINSAITKQFRNGTWKGEVWPEKYYRAFSFEGLLRPGSKYGKTSRFNRLYQTLYEFYNSNDFESYEDLYQAINSMIRKEERQQTVEIIYVGSHGLKDDKDSGFKAGPLPESILNELNDAIIEEVEKTAGRGNDSLELFLKELKENRKLRMDVLTNFAITQKVNCLKSFFPVTRRSRTVVPINPSRRDIMKLAMGIMPITWNNTSTRIKEKNEGVAIYLDLSGSVNAHLPRIVKLIVNVKKDINLIHGFSTYIYEHKMSELKAGKIKTDGGTDFTCIAQHALEKGYNSIIIITDGYANCRQDVLNKFASKIRKGAVILFGEQPAKENCFSLMKDKFKTFLLEEVIR